MNINTYQKSICINPSRHHYFWENKIINDANLWEGYFENEIIHKNSKIIYTGLIDNEKNIFHYGFAVYPSTYKLLGFLQHVFLPTAFFTWFDCESHGFYIPLSSYDIVVSEVQRCNKNIDENLVNSMNNWYSFITNLWLFDLKFIDIGLKSFCEKFNNEWDKDSEKKLFLKIFDSPSQVFNFVKDSIGWSEYDDFVEEELSMSLEKLKFTCDNVLTEPLLNKKFIDILNTNMPVLF